jgi:hypothetical protein
LRRGGAGNPGCGAPEDPVQRVCTRLSTKRWPDRVWPVGNRQRAAAKRPAGRTNAAISKGAQMSRSGAVNQREARAQSNTRRISRRTPFTSSHDPRLGRNSTMTIKKRNRPEPLIVRRCLTRGKCPFWPGAYRRRDTTCHTDIQTAPLTAPSPQTDTAKPPPLAGPAPTGAPTEETLGCRNPACRTAGTTAQSLPEPGPDPDPARPRRQPRQRSPAHTPSPPHGSAAVRLLSRHRLHHSGREAQIRRPIRQFGNSAIPQSAPAPSPAARTPYAPPTADKTRQTEQTETPPPRTVSKHSPPDRPAERRTAPPAHLPTSATLSRRPNRWYALHDDRRHHQRSCCKQ